MIEDINAPQPYLTIFPEAASVFAAPVEKYAQHLHPLLSIDLSVVNPAWSGVVHLISPVEPYSGFMGEYTQAFHNDYLKTNWIAFKLNAENRYELLGDFKYFALENVVLDTPIDSPEESESAINAYREMFDEDFMELLENTPKDYRQELEAHYAQSHIGYRQAKEKYAKYGGLYGDNGGETLAEKREYFTEPWNFLDQLGGTTGWANWTSYCEDFGIKLNAGYYDEGLEDDIYPISPAGNRFYFIAGVPAWHYITNGYSGADWIVMYYEPIERIVWFTFDYT